MYSKWIKDIRNSLNLTQQQLATLIGASTSTINRYENGLTVPSPSHQLLLKIVEHRDGMALLQRIRRA